MTTQKPSRRTRRTPAQPDSSGLWWYLVSASAALMLVILMGGLNGYRWWRSLPFDPQWSQHDSPVPLVMQGGDPYIRALMRTISASESSGPRPYSLLYGGEHIVDLSQHPDRCVRIFAGPNIGNCSTAAGRYQMLTTTWYEKAKKYHPNPPILFWESYNFAPEYQDEVVYRWLSDSQYWGINLSQLLQEGHVHEVLRVLSPTWTSLGYGIETNVVSDDLPDIYQQMLQEELKTASASSPSQQNN